MKNFVYFVGIAEAMGSNSVQACICLGINFSTDDSCIAAGMKMYTLNLPVGRTSTTSDNTNIIDRDDN